MAHERRQQKQLRELLAERPKNGYSPTEASGWTGSLMLGLGCLGPDGFRPTQLKNAPRNAPKRTDALLSPGDVLMSRSNTREAVGFVGIFQDVGAPCIYPDLMMRLKFADTVEDRFVVKFLQSSMGRRQIEAAACGTSGSMVKLNRAAVEGFFIPVPPIPEQRRVTEILDTLDVAIQKTEQLIAKLKQVKQGLLNDLLTRGIDENGELRDPERHPEQFKKSPLGRVPKMWAVAPAHELCVAVIDCKNRTPPITSSGHPVLRTPNVRDGRFRVADLLFTDSQSYEVWTQRGKPQPGDVLITREAPVGEACLIPEWLPNACLGQRMMLYRPDPTQLNNEFMLAALLSRPIQKLLIDWAGGSTVSHVKVGDIHRLPLPVPPLREQEQIALVLAATSQRMSSEERELEKLRLLKHGLMEDLLTGGVRVTPLLNEAAP